MAALIRRQLERLHLRHSRSYRSYYINESCGLYGFDYLKTATGFRTFVDQAIQRSGELINYISLKPTSTEVIRAMDEISDTICSVVDSAELCRNTHPDREFVEEANKASMRINEYLHFLNTNHTLYDAVKKAEKGLLPNNEAQRAAAMFSVDFEKGGIHLTHDKLDRVNELNISICQLSSEYTENVVNDPGCIDIFSASRLSKSLHHLVKPIYRSTSSNHVKEKGYRIITDPSTLSFVLQGASDSEVRKMAYIKGYSVPSANLGVLEKLISARHELAQTLGYKSYAEFVQHPNMATSPDVVMPFLLEMSEMVRPMANKEVKRIWDFKRERSGQLDCDLEPWDEAYFTGLMKSSAYGLDSSVVASYFPLSQCIEGLKLLVESLFGLTFKSIPLAPGESWHPDVLKMSLFHPDEGDLGFLYLDLNPRKGKYPGCAHFAIRGDDVSRRQNTNFLFTGSRNSASVKLNHGDVETLFHEFGHALHSLLSQTDYQHFSGTRVALELAETPSNLFEYYAWDYRVLKTFARHYSTGEIIPEKLVQSMRGAREMFAATELQRQIFYAITDQTLFGEQSASQIDTIPIVGDLKRRHTSWKHVDGTHWHTRFTHLLTYGAGYYSYLYAKCFASTIWHKICEEDPLSLATGNALRTQFLQHGGAKDPAFLLNDLVGDGIFKYHGGGIVPDITSLCKEMNMVDWSPKK